MTGDNIIGRDRMRRRRYEAQVEEMMRREESLVAKWAEARCAAMYSTSGNPHHPDYLICGEPKEHDGPHRDIHDRRQTFTQETRP